VHLSLAPPPVLPIVSEQRQWRLFLLAVIPL